MPLSIPKLVKKLLQRDCGFQKCASIPPSQDIALLLGDVAVAISIGRLALTIVIVCALVSIGVVVGATIEP